MPNATPPSHDPELRFGRFRLLLSKQALYEGDRELSLGSRALQILTILCQRPGALVTRQELLSRVWPGLHVEDAALRVHIAALRKALGPSADGTPYIVNVPGSGYRLGAPIATAAPVRPQAHNLPLSLARIVGRDEAVGSIATQLPQHRLMTIVGSGGIGKTTVAVAVGERLLAAYPDGVYFVDLSLLTHDGQVAATVALVLGLSNLSEDPTAGVVASLREKRLLIVLDNCERVIEGSAFMVERVLTGAPDVHILATSREPLRARGERVLRLPPLDAPGLTPGSTQVITAAQALIYPAVELFVERASASLGGFTLSDSQAPLVAEICARLDGIALAIELVAGHVGAFGLQALATMLNDRFRLLGPGRRTAMPRHRTLRAVLDWSFETIGEYERLLLTRLGVFNGAADLSAVQAVAEDAALPDALESLARLVDKSLVIADIRSGRARYRLLDTTRAYAAEKLRLSGEQATLAKRLAEHYLAAFVRAQAAWTAKSSAAWLAEHARELENVRTALDWAFSADGDVALGIRLSAESLPLMFELSLAEECRRRAATALSAMETTPDADRRLEMRIRTVLGAALTYTPGPIPQSTAVWESVLQAATVLGDRVTEARATWGLWNACVYGGRPREALPYAERFRRLTITGDEAHPRLLGERIIGITLHFTGAQQAARDHLERMLLDYRPASHNFQTPGSQIDHALVGQATLSRILWVQGLPDQALAVLQTSLAGVRAQNHAISVCYVIFEAALPLLLMVGNLEAAAFELQHLEVLAEQNGLAIWQAGARCMRLAFHAARGEPVPIAQIRHAFSALRATGYTAHLSWLSGVIAQGPASRDEAGQRMALVDEALATCERTGEQWGVAELLRIRGLLMMDAGEDDLFRALHLAREQGARSWELRAATSLGLLLQKAYRTEEARALLQPAFDSFTEGFDTTDLLQAAAVLRSL